MQISVLQQLDSVVCVVSEEMGELLLGDIMGSYRASDK